MNTTIRSCVVMLAGCLLLSMAACRSRATVKAEEARTSSKNVQPSAAPIGGTYCLETFAQGPAPAGSLHFNYKESGSDGSLKDFAGELSGDDLDSTVHEKRVAGDLDREMASDKSLNAPPVVDGFVETNRSQHSTRSDPSGWSMASGGSVHAFAPWGLFIAKPNVRPAGTENVAGFDAIKYTVDTEGQSQLDKMPLTLTGGLKDYSIKGTVWTDTKQQCILQYSIDYQGVKKDGTTSTTHYEGSTTRQ